MKKLILAAAILAISCTKQVSEPTPTPIDSNLVANDGEVVVKFNGKTLTMKNTHYSCATKDTVIFGANDTMSMVIHTDMNYIAVMKKDMSYYLIETDGVIIRSFKNKLCTGWAKSSNIQVVYKNIPIY